MAVGWVTALKLVPWGDVLEATPQILQAAKKLLGSTRQGTADAAAGTLAAKKRRAPSNSGGTSASPFLIAIKLSPQITTTHKAFSISCLNMTNTKSFQRCNFL